MVKLVPGGDGISWFTSVPGTSLLSFSGSGSPFSGVVGGGGVVCVLERDMMIASCHGGIREDRLRWH
jgi:hypothetical protein